jgi:hypothetical protein
MPTYKHPCPRCGQLIARDVVRCPFCGTVDPFVPGRCPRCRTPIEDLSWIACAKCGAPLKPGVSDMPSRATPSGAGASSVLPGAPADPAAADGPPSSPLPAPAAGAAPAPAPGQACSGCGAALAPGAPFCAACGTLAG